MLDTTILTIELTKDSGRPSPIEARPLRIRFILSYFKTVKNCNRKAPTQVPG